MVMVVVFDFNEYINATTMPKNAKMGNSNVTYGNYKELAGWPMPEWQSGVYTMCATNGTVSARFTHARPAIFELFHSVAATSGQMIHAVYNREAAAVGLI